MSWFHDMPVVRSPYTGKPVASNVRNVNRSEVIRRIFRAKGDIGNEAIWHMMNDEGIPVTVSLINAQRKKVFQTKGSGS